mmetsp:Transcript_19943/g.26924  ORF Transcript_19943/g.26924 Transcript_19943/m.26924 type:complete len:138 (+) Transcript_19943:678-1091(+)|eukprot:CAMPEP_0185583338 /NCGR_PEP_ID=MMETSP0434-20130131/21462_1 /TAXON_ID=626734 ORGANISM="Favella taraikaensis, Strain Fe Narragansett Bay" /NCGR_SAMPLE_ID=MMETSP0434 /ASSEMBLY_ACC=CAM_ASM_000379 /LENGTH=137 /DNA_ID=CAMNT_0028202383 /DNA_START=632 /DNA_END=1045 /DNA_ORIENTATION=+
MQQEIEHLKNYAIGLKAKVSIYVPVKDDPVDQKMADYLNSVTDRQKLKIMFMRESSGIYEFGTKRVEVRVAKGKILIRVGGGYQNIDEFLEQYTPEEMVKIMRRDPNKRFAEKVALAKTIEGKGVTPQEFKDPDRFD